MCSYFFFFSLSLSTLSIEQPNQFLSSAPYLQKYGIFTLSVCVCLYIRSFFVCFDCVRFHLTQKDTRERLLCRIFGHIYELNNCLIVVISQWSVCLDVWVWVYGWNEKCSPWCFDCINFSEIKLQIHITDDYRRFSIGFIILDFFFVWHINRSIEKCLDGIPSI